MSVRYAHTNVVARDWKALVAFYRQVFGCEPIGPERHHHGVWFEDCTSISNAEVVGVHLLMPGYDSRGPTLEIFQYNQVADGPMPALNRPGLAHLAFEVDDVAAYRRRVLDAGGRDYGKTVKRQIPGAGTIELIYMTDPEGNVVELQHWSE